jgi:hypothetical protein
MRLSSGGVHQHPETGGKGSGPRRKRGHQRPLGARAAGIKEARAGAFGSRLPRFARRRGDVVDLGPDHDARAFSRRAIGSAVFAVAVAPARTTRAHIPHGS